MSLRWVSVWSLYPFFSTPRTYWVLFPQLYTLHSKTNVTPEQWFFGRLLLLLRYAVSRVLFLFLGSIYVSCQESQSFQNVKFRTANARQFTAMPPLQALLRHGLVVWLGAPKLRWQHGRYQGGGQLERFTVFSRNSKNRALASKCTVDLDSRYMVVMLNLRFLSTFKPLRTKTRWWEDGGCHGLVVLPSRLIRGADEMGGRENWGCTWFVRVQEMYLNSYIIYTYSPYFWRSAPQNKGFSNQSKGHWGCCYS